MHSALTRLAKLLIVLIYGAAIWASVRLVQGGLYVLFQDRGRLYATAFPPDSALEALALAVFLALLISACVYACLLLWEACRQAAAAVIRWFAVWRLLLMGVLLALTFLFHGPYGFVIGGVALLVFHVLAWQTAFHRRGR